MERQPPDRTLDPDPPVLSTRTVPRCRPPSPPSMRPTPVMAALAAALVLGMPASAAAGPALPQSVWSRPLPPMTPVGPGSASMVQALATAASQQAYLNTKQFTSRIYVVPPDQPKVRVVRRRHERLAPATRGRAQRRRRGPDPRWCPFRRRSPAAGTRTRRSSSGSPAGRTAAVTEPAGSVSSGGCRLRR